MKIINLGFRAAHSCDKIGNKLFIFGGWNGFNALDDLHIYNLQTNSWEETKIKSLDDIPPSARNNHTTACVGSKLYIHGGHDGN